MSVFMGNPLFMVVIKPPFDSTAPIEAGAHYDASVLPEQEILIDCEQVIPHSRYRGMP